MPTRRITHYLAIGSNISARAWGVWRRRCGLDRGLLRAVGRAVLPDHRLAFHYHSSTWSGGALDVVPQVGACVPGFLFALRPGALGALDRKEGAPHCYERVVVEAITEQGDAVLAWVYRVTDGARQDRFVPPAPAYLDAVVHGYESRGMTDLRMLQAAAAGASHAPPERHIAVYGTLRRGELRAPLLQRVGAKLVDTLRLPGRLHDLGAYPGAVLDPEGGGIVAELYAVADIARALPTLDAVEGFAGWARGGSLFRRTLVHVPGGEAGERRSWVYVLADPGVGAPVIRSGDWLARAGGR